MRVPINVRWVFAVLVLVAIAVTAAVTASAKPNKAQAKYVLGVSNTLVGNGWREEMICAVKAQALASGGRRARSSSRTATAVPRSRSRTSAT